MTLLESALALAGKGFRIFPLRPLSKAPTFANPFQRSTTDPDTIRTWWSGRGRRHNIGVHLPGILVIDIDGETGERNFQQLATEREFPPTAEVKTSSGRHLYYRLPHGLRATPHPLDTVPAFHKNAHGDKYDKIDIKGSGGLVAGPGSIHKSGTVYAWVNEPESVESLTPAPAWMIATLCEREDPKYLVTLTTEEFEEPGSDNELLQVLLVRFPLAPGTRHDQTGRVACWLLGRGLTQEKATAVAERWLLVQGRDDREAHSDLLRTLDRAYAGLLTGTTHLMTDHQQATADYYFQHTTNARAQNAFCALAVPSGLEEELFLTALWAHVKYEVDVMGRDPGGVHMTHRQLMRVFELIHGRKLSWKKLGVMLSRFTTRGEQKAQKVELVSMLSVGRIGSSSVYTVCESVKQEFNHGNSRESCGGPERAVRTAVRRAGRPGRAESGSQNARPAAQLPPSGRPVRDALHDAAVHGEPRNSPPRRGDAPGRTPSGPGRAESRGDAALPSPEVPQTPDVLPRGTGVRPGPVAAGGDGGGRGSTPAAVEARDAEIARIMEMIDDADD